VVKIGLHLRKLRQN